MANQDYTGGCHCGSVRYRVELDLEQPAITCNCSICSKTGTMLSFVQPAAFRLEQGADQLTDYQFNKHAIHHLFCKTCGVRSFARGESPRGAMVAINVRCLDDVDLGTLTLKAVDGKQF